MTFFGPQSLRHTNNTHTFLHFSSVLVLTRLTFLAKKVLVFLPGSWAWKNSPCTDLLVCHNGVKFLLKEQSNSYLQWSEIFHKLFCFIVCTQCAMRRLFLNQSIAMHTASVIPVSFWCRIPIIFQFKFYNSQPVDT